MKRFAAIGGMVVVLACAGAATAADTLLVGNKSDDTLWRLSLEDGRKLGEAATAPGPHEIAVSPDGQLAVVSGYGRQPPGNAITVLDGAGTRVLRTIDLGRHTGPHGMRFTPDGKLLVTTEHSASLLRVDPVAGKVEQAIAVGGGMGHMVAVSRDGSAAYVSKLSGGSVTRVDLANGRTLERPAGEGAEGIEVAADGSVWVTNRDDGTVTVHDPDTLEILATLPSPGFPIRVAFTADGRHALVTNARAGTLTVFDAHTRTPVATVALTTPGKQYRPTLLGEAALPIGVIADPVRPRVYVAISGANEIAVVDTERWAVVAHWATGNEPDALGLPH